MKIKYFKLTNFAGIKYGINNKVLELTDIPSGIIMLTGQNGCGKSTTLHTLHVFSDDKTFLIKKEDESFEPAEKELIVEHNDNEYRILHQYSRTGSKKSFIQKNGEELNGAGNVTTFENVIFEEFGMENNTVSNSVIGVSEINFIDLTSSERKKQISTLLPNISEYEKLYKTSNDSLNGAKKQIQMLSQLIANSGGIENIESKIEEINSKVNPILEDIDKLNSDLVSQKENKAAKEALYNKSIEEESALKVEVGNETSRAAKAVELISTFANPPKETDLSVLYSKKEVLNNQMTELNNLKSEIQNKINLFNSEWSAYQDKVNYQKNIESNRNSLIDKKNKLEEEINILKENLNKKKSIDIKNYYNKETENWIVYIGKSLKDEVDSLKNIYTESINGLSAEEAYDDIANTNSKIELFNSKEKELEMYSSYLSMFKNMADKANEQTNTNIELTDGCSFSKCSVQYKHLIDIYTDKYNKLHNFLETNRDKYLQYTRLKKLYDTYAHCLDDRQQLAEFLGLDKNLFCSSKNFESILTALRTIKKEISDYLFNSSNLLEEEKYINSKLEYLASLNKQISELKDIEIKELQFNLEDVEKLKKDIENTVTDIFNLKIKIDSVAKEIELATEYSKLDETKRFLDEFNKKTLNVSKLVEQGIGLKRDMDTIDNLIVSTMSSIKAKNEIIDELHKELKENNENLAIIKDQISNKNRLDTEINHRNMVVSALHPTKGIPSLLVKDYLGSIENISNNILEKTFDSSYKIFLENLEKDFYIRVFEKSTNRYISDVKLCSSGQQAIIKLVLSIALTKCAVGNAIYLRLDECDSVLSKENLAMVEVLLNSLLDKFGIEQVFIVTHNSSVSVCDLTVHFDREEQNYNLKRI